MKKVLVLDFGGQYNLLVARRVRECGVYCEIKPYTMSMDDIRAFGPAAIIFTGILGSILGPVLCKLFHLTDPVAQGVAFGTAAHVIGTAKATELNALSGAVSSLSLVVAGLLTAVVFPLIPTIL